MDIQEVKERLQALVEERFKDDPEHFLVDVKIAGRRITVFIDGDDGIKIAECAKMSRHLESYLDEGQWMGENYILEVSSPGMSNPLKVLRQYKRRIGREVRVVKTNGEGVEGELRSADEEKVVLEYIKRKKGKVLERKTFEIPFEEIKNTKLILNF